MVRESRRTRKRAVENDGLPDVSPEAIPNVWYCVLTYDRLKEHELKHRECP